MAKKRLTPNQKEYRRQVVNLRRRMNRAIKEGFIFSEAQYDLLNMPNRVTKQAIERLKRQNRKAWNISQPVIDRTTGIAYPNIRQAREAEAWGKKNIDIMPYNGRNRSELVMTAFRAEIDSLREWTTYVSYGDTRLDFLRNIEAIENVVNTSIESQGIEAVARALEAMAEELGTQDFITYDNVRSRVDASVWCRSFLNNLFEDEDIVNDMLEAGGIFGLENSGVESVEDSDLGL